MVPFTRFVDDFSATWRAVGPEAADEEGLAGQFVGRLYDLFVDHRGLVMTLWASDAVVVEELTQAVLHGFLHRER